MVVAVGWDERIATAAIETGGRAGKANKPDRSSGASFFLSWQMFGKDRFRTRKMPPRRENRAPLRLKVLHSSASSSSIPSSSFLNHGPHDQPHEDEENKKNNSSLSTVGESISSSSSSSFLDEPPNRESRRVRFASAPEREPDTSTTAVTTSSSSSSSSSSRTADEVDCCSSGWYSRDELEQMERERHRDLDALVASSSTRGLMVYRRLGDNEAFGKILYRLLVRFRHDDAEECDDNDAGAEDGDDSFSIDRADFHLLRRYIARNAHVTGMERNVAESVASETRAMIGNVQQSVLMVQGMLATVTRRGGDHEHDVDECLRCASLRYSAPSRRFARALGEVHAQVVNVPS